MLHFNHEYEDGLPLATGDRYYAQDLAQDNKYLASLPIELISKWCGADSGILRGFDITTQLDGNDQLYSITVGAGVGFCKIDTKVIDPEENWTLPPVVKDEQIFKMLSITDPLTITNPSGQYLCLKYKPIMLLERGRIATGGRYHSYIEDSCELIVSNNITGILIGTISGNTITKSNIISPVIDDDKTSKENGWSGEKIQNELGNKLSTSGGTLNGILVLKNESYISNENDDTLLGWTEIGTTYTGGQPKSTVVGSLRGSTVIRSKADDLFHYNRAKAKRLKIIDEGHLSYVSGEVDTGYKWINGKEVYKRVDSWSLITLPTGNSSYNLSSSYWGEIDNLISFSLLRPKTKDLIGAYIPANVRFDPSTKKLDIYGIPTAWTGPFYIIVEYTKT